MSGHVLCADSELRYIFQWFNEWSELQRGDFLPILLEYLSKDGTGQYINGVFNTLAASTFEEKPMSLFQCRVKLFREWSALWPEEHKIILKEKICEIDTSFGEKLQTEILNGYANGNARISEHLSPNQQPSRISAQNDAILA